MKGINLLPWREERRRARGRRMLALSILFWVACAGVVLGGLGYFKVMQENQQVRNNYLNSEISKLDEKIREINALRAQKDNLIARMEVIQNLQRERTQVVHLFDDLVRKLPEGVFYSAMNKKAKKFSFSGTAQSNARVSELMNHLDSSEWFANPDLSVINVTPSEGVRLSQFQLSVSEEIKRDEMDEEVVN